MRIEIPIPHGKAIAARMQMMQQMVAQFNLVRSEDKRHVDAVIETLGQDPQQFESYDLALNDGRYYLELRERQRPPAVAPEPAPLTQHVNGAVQPEA